MIYGYYIYNQCTEDKQGSPGLSVGLDARTLGLLDGLCVGLRGAGASEQGRGLEGSLEVAGGWLAEEVDLDHVALERALDRGDGLHEERVGVLHVQVHEAHHRRAAVDGLERAVQLLQVVVAHRGHVELVGLARERVARRHVLERRQVVLGHDLAPRDLVHGKRKHRRRHVRDPDVQDVRLVLHVDLARELHHHEHHNYVADLGVHHCSGLCRHCCRV